MRILGSKPGEQRPQILQNRTTMKLARNWTRQIQRTYQIIFDSSHICSTRRNSKNYQRCEWDHEINLMEEATKELNAKAYMITLKEEEALN